MVILGNNVRVLVVQLVVAKGQQVRIKKGTKNDHNLYSSLSVIIFYNNSRLTDM